jgi:hypothetical protein
MSVRYLVSEQAVKDEVFDTFFIPLFDCKPLTLPDSTNTTFELGITSTSAALTNMGFVNVYVNRLRYYSSQVSLSTSLDSIIFASALSTGSLLRADVWVQGE